MSDLIDTLERLMKRDYALVLSGITVQKKEVSIICSDGKHVTAINVISAVSQVPEAIGSCSSYLHSVHKTYIALPDKDLKKITYERKILTEMGIGLISFSDKNYDIVLESKKYDPDPSLLKVILGEIGLMKRIRDAADSYKAIAHPTRLRIYLTVKKNGSARLKDIAETGGGCYPLIMKHVKILEESGLIESERSGKETTLKLRSSPIDIDDIIDDNI